MDVYEKMKKMGISLPKPADVIGKYLPVKMIGNMAYVSGQGPIIEGKPFFIGKFTKESPIEIGQEAARICIMNSLAALQAKIGDLNRVKNVVKVSGFIASAPGFNDQPIVINGGSQLLIDLFGERGQHARSAIGVNELPGNIPVEIEVIFEIE
jgi:enamine deaminase RidA (YjgF/YER057c/UK114 family)